MMKITQRLSNGFRERSRLKVTLIGFSFCLIAAVLKHWLQGISEGLVITAAGIITAYIAGDSFRPSHSNSSAPHEPPEIPLNL